MNAKQLIAVSLVAFAGTAALADDITIDNTAIVSTRSRAEVQAEVQQARTQGTLYAAGEFAPVAGSVPSTTTREVVCAEVRAANARHELLPAGEVLTYASRTVRNANMH